MFFQNLKSSIYSPKFYQELLAKPFSYSVKYFWIFAVVFSIVGASILSFTLVPAAKLFVGELGPKIIDYYPAELQVTIKNGQVSTNVQEPYFLKLPEGFDSKESNITNALVIDTQNNFTLEKFQSYSTFAWLTKNSLVSFKQGGINIQPIDKAANFYLDKSVISSFYDKFRPILNFIYPVIPAIVFIGYMFSFAFYMLYMFFGALIVWFACTIKGVKIKYFKAYQLGLHLLTPVIIIELLLKSFHIQNYIPFFGIILLFVFALVNINKKREENSENSINMQSGQVARIMLALVVVCAVAIAIAYIVINSARKPAIPVAINSEGTTTVPKAIYEVTSNDIKISFQEAYNFGNTLYGSQSSSQYQKNLTTTEKYIMVTIGAQNKGKEDTPTNVWDLGNIIDSEGRIFIPANYDVYSWLPKNNACGNVLKPEFTPLSCTKIYEVSKTSQGLKVQALVAQKTGEGKYDNGKKETILLDMIINNK